MEARRARELVRRRVRGARGAPVVRGAGALRDPWVEAARELGALHRHQSGVRLSALRPHPLAGVLHVHGVDVGAAVGAGAARRGARLHPHVHDGGARVGGGASGQLQIGARETPAAVCERVLFGGQRLSVVGQVPGRRAVEEIFDVAGDPRSEALQPVSHMIRISLPNSIAFSIY